MKVLTTGLLVFVSWSAISTYVYVCKIKDLCTKQIQTTSIVREKPDVMKPEILSVPGLDSLILHFDFNDTVFIPDKHLAGYTLQAMEYLNANPKKEIHITGYADSIGTEDYNQNPGMRRALDVRAYFIKHGIDEKRITVASDSKDEPVSTNKTSRGREKNRRVKIEIK